MKPFTVLLLAVLAAAGTAFLVTTVRTPAPASAAPSTAAAPEANLARDLEALRARADEQAKAIEGLTAELARKTEPRVPLGEIEAAVARALEKSRPAGDATLAAAPAKSATAPGKIDTKALFEKLSDPNLSWDEAQALWKSASDAGQLKEMIALFEERAKNSPNDGRAQRELGKAYLQKVFTSSDMEKGMWATKADKAFDKALGIDDHDGEARLQKAISLSFWPAAFGKQNEAISHFEILAKQQESQALQPHFAQTHLWLGNMYSQTGQNDKALAAWKKGLALFPDNAELKKQIELATSGTPH